MKGSDSQRSDTLACPDTIHLLDFPKISDIWFGSSTAGRDRHRCLQGLVEHRRLTPKRKCRTWDPLPHAR